MTKMIDSAITTYMQKNSNTQPKTVKLQARQQCYHIDRIEQHDKRNDIKIRGLATENDEDLPQKVVDLAKEINVTINKDDFICYRTGRSDNANRPVLVKLNDQRTKVKIMRAKKNLGTGKYIDEDLTRLRSKLYYEVRHDANTTKYWTIDGKIYAMVKPSGGGEPTKTCFQTPDDLAILGWDEGRVEDFMNSLNSA